MASDLMVSSDVDRFESLALVTSNGCFVGAPPRIGDDCRPEPEDRLCLQGGIDRQLRHQQVAATCSICSERAQLKVIAHI